MLEVAEPHNLLPVLSHSISAALLDLFLEIILETASTTIKNAKILLVDDSSTQLLLLREILITGGYINLHETTDPRMVLELQNKHEFDLILLYINMPYLTGFDVMDLLTKHNSTQKTASIITISGNTDDQTKKRALENGANDFIAKPFHVESILNQVSRQLEGQLVNDKCH